MSSFKYKPPKKIILDEKSITTLDSKHKEIQTEYQYIQDIVIPGLKKEKAELKERLSQIKQSYCIASAGASAGASAVDNDQVQALSPTSPTSPPKDNAKTTIDEIMEIRDRMKEINSNIKNYEQTYKNYYLNNSEYIF